MHGPTTITDLDDNDDNISGDNTNNDTHSLSSSSSAASLLTYSSTDDELIRSPKTSENITINNDNDDEVPLQQQQQEPTIHFAAFPQRPTVHTAQHPHHWWRRQEGEEWENDSEYEDDEEDYESIWEKIINTISSFYTRFSLWFQNKKSELQRERQFIPRSRRIAEVPFCIATFSSVYGTFILVRAAAVNGWIVDHSHWDGTGHEFDKNPVVSINKLETLAIYISIICGIIISIFLIARTRMCFYFVSKWCLWLAYLQGVLCLSSVYGFILRSNASFIMNNNSTYVYSRGFWSGLFSSIMFFMSAFSFTVDWLLSYPYSKLSIVLKGLVLPSIMLCSTVIIGTLSYMILEDWTYSKSIVFCWTGITTIGYGDITPSSSKGRIFFLLYTVFGISIVGYMLLSIRAVITGTSSDIMKVNLMRVESLHDYSRHQRQKWVNQQQYRQQLFDNTNNNNNNSHNNSPGTPLLRRYSSSPEASITGRGNDTTDNNNNDDGITFSPSSSYPNNNSSDKRFQGRGPRSLSNVSTFSAYTIAGILDNKDRQILVQVITKSGVVRMGIILIICWFGGAGIFCFLEQDWSYLDGLYFVFGTQLTIGFGDIVPQTALAQEFWLAYIIVSIAVAAYFISLCGDTLIEKLQIQDDNEDPESLFYTDEIAGSPPPMDDYTDTLYNNPSASEHNLALDNNGVSRVNGTPFTLQQPVPGMAFSPSLIDKQETDINSDNGKRTTPVTSSSSNRKFSPPVLFRRSQLVRHSSLPNVSTGTQLQHNTLTELARESAKGPVGHKGSFPVKRKQHPLRIAHKPSMQAPLSSLSSPNIRVTTTPTITTPTPSSSSNIMPQTRTNNIIQSQQENKRQSRRHYQYGSFSDTKNPMASSMMTSSDDVGYFNKDHHKNIDRLKHPASPLSPSEEQKQGQEMIITSPSTTNNGEVILKFHQQKHHDKQELRHSKGSSGAIEESNSVSATGAVKGQLAGTHQHSIKKKKASKYLPIAVTDSNCSSSSHKKHHF